jgi:hypothetical protein
MYGMNMYGMGMGGGMGMPGQGQEMMIISLCCLCCLCCACLAAGYMTNMFCGISPSMGSKCQKETSAPTRSYEDEEPSRQASGTVDGCHEAYARKARTGKDPRPPIDPSACTNTSRVVGRDCYFWEAQLDPVTGLARWMRKADPEDPNADMRTGGDCAPSVQCPNFIDPKSLAGYTESNAAALLKHCTAVQGTATTENDTVALLTREARKVGRDGWAGVNVEWTAADSKRWYDRVARYVAQKDLKAYIANTGTAVTALKGKLNTRRIRKSTYAFMLEAAVRAPDNSPTTIIDVTNRWVGTAMSTRDRNEATFVAYLQANIRGMVDWQRVLDAPFPK